MPPTLSGVGSSSAIYIKTTDTELTWFSSHADSVSYILNVYNGSSCSGTLVRTETTTQTTYFVQNMSNGQTYSVSISTKKGDQKSKDAACSPDFIVDLDAPNTPAISDPTGAVTVASNSYTMQWSSRDNGPSGLHPTETYKFEQFSNGTCAATKWCLSETQSAPPIATGSCAGGRGGSGGAIDLTAGTLAGATRTLRARGGSGQNRGGGGGGGRIKYTIATDFDSRSVSALPKLVTGGTSTLGFGGAFGSAVAGP